MPATIALTGLTLSVALGFGRLFADARFLPPVLLATLVGHGVAWWCRRNDLPTPIAAVATLGAVGLIASWTVLGHTTAYGVPLPLTVRDGLEMLGAARAQFSTVRAPAAVLPGFVLATVLAIGVSAFMADWAAFRLQATFEAIIPAFTLFIFTAALGTSRHRTWAVTIFVAAALSFLVVHGLARSNRAGAWFGGQPATGRSALVRTAVGLGGLALGLGLLLGPLVPGPESAIVKYKNRPNGPSNRATISPLVDIRGRLVDQARIEVFTVKSSVKSYWRLTSLDTFNGTIWSSNDTYRETKGTIRSTEPLVPDLPTATAEQEFSVSGLASIWLPAAFRPERIEGIDDVSYNQDTASLITPADTTDGSIYTVRSSVPQLTPELLATAPAQAPQEVVTRYLALPPVAERVRAEAHRVTDAAATPYAKARSLQDYFHRGFKYNLDAQPGHDERALENFLFRTREGYCEQYAGAYAVMARTIGLPTRVAVGFTPGELQSDGTYHVRDEHAHAWPEVYLHNFGWVAFEPTPGRGAPNATAYTGRPEAQDERGNASTAETTAPPTTAPGAGEDGPTTVPDLGSGADSVDASEDEHAGLTGFEKTALAALALVVVWAIVVPLLHLQRRRSRRSAPGTAAQVLADWADTSEVLSAAGIARQPSETMTEYADRASRSAGLQPDPSKALRSLAKDAALAAYTEGDVPDEIVDRASLSAKTVRTAVLDQVSVTDRVAWWLDPRPLIGTDRAG
ncbi:MAG TPA: transglutaminaseTgpA domain-containing protein [Acidimicrobiales bacterium]|nr:transglutaminaseTgpA domain-containing protein [Acidimicrobiales bacterium]